VRIHYNSTRRPPSPAIPISAPARRPLLPRPRAPYAVLSSIQTQASSPQNPWPPWPARRGGPVRRGGRLIANPRLTFLPNHRKLSPLRISNRERTPLLRSPSRTAIFYSPPRPTLLILLATSHSPLATAFLIVTKCGFCIRRGERDSCIRRGEPLLSSEWIICVPDAPAGSVLSVTGLRSRVAGSVLGSFFLKSRVRSSLQRPVSSFQPPAH